MPQKKLHTTKVREALVIRVIIEGFLGEIGGKMINSSMPKMEAENPAQSATESIDEADRFSTTSLNYPET